MQSLDLAQYLDFPPFFTLQPCKETRATQLSLWSRHVLKYCKDNHVKLLDFNSFPLFENKKINRKLDIQTRLLIMDRLSQEGFCRKVSERMYEIVEKTASSWAYIIHQALVDESYVMDLLNTEEIRTGDRFADYSFHNLDEKTFNECIELLVKDHKVERVDHDTIKVLY